MVLALAVGGSTVSAPPAQAGNCTIGFASLLCGKVKNVGTTPVRLIASWPSTYGVNLPAGQTSTRYYKDTDGIYVYSGYKVLICASGGYCNWYGSGGHKLIDNLGTYTVKVVRK